MIVCKNASVPLSHLPYEALGENRLVNRLTHPSRIYRRVLAGVSDEDEFCTTAGQFRNHGPQTGFSLKSRPERATQDNGLA